MLRTLNFILKFVKATERFYSIDNMVKLGIKKKINLAVVRRV